MKCGNYFCIYNEGEKCILEEISLDIQGKCEECIYVDIDEKTLNEYKNKKSVL